MANFNQEMGYDRTITMFSPDGRLLQVEYAKKTVEKGNDALGFACKDGVLLISTKKSHDKLMVLKSVEKSYVIDNHIISVSSGMLSDARVLIDRCRVVAQENRIKFDSNLDVLSLVKNVSDLMQYYTQAGGMRPFGVSFTIGGIDSSGAKVYKTDPSGVYFEFLATSTGKNEEEINKLLVEKYDKNLLIKDAVKIGFDILKVVQKEEFDKESLDIIYLKDEKDATPVILFGDEVNKHFGL